VTFLAESIAAAVFEFRNWKGPFIRSPKFASNRSPIIPGENNLDLNEVTPQSSSARGVSSEKTVDHTQGDVSNSTNQKRTSRGVFRKTFKRKPFRAQLNRITEVTENPTEMSGFSGSIAAVAELPELS
jgi:hypothetical protein